MPFLTTWLKRKHAIKLSGKRFKHKKEIFLSKTCNKTVGHTAIGVVEIKIVIQKGTAEIDGCYTHWSQTKLWLKIPKQQLLSGYTLFLYSFSLTNGHHQKQDSGTDLW